MMRFSVVPMLWVLLFPALAAIAQDATAPVAGLRETPPRTHHLIHATVFAAPGRVIQDGCVTISDGRIVAVRTFDSLDEPLSDNDPRCVNLAGCNVYPGFIDAWSERDTPAVTTGAPHWNSQIQPQRALSRLLPESLEDQDAYREHGIVARLAAPSDGVVKGVSALLLTGDGPARQNLVGDVALHAELTVSFSRRRERTYPTSPMGAVALARQTFLDAQWMVQAEAAHRADATLPAIQPNDALSALRPYLEQQLVIFDAANELFFLRADRFAREFGLRAVIHGSGLEYRRLEAIAQTGRSVILPVDFPKPPNVATAQAVRNTTLESLMHWRLAPENPARLVAAGVPIAFTTEGLDDPDDFLPAIRKAIRRGLAPQDALRALTLGPAEMLGFDDEMGAIAPGKAAHLVVSRGDLLGDEKSEIVETWVGGRRYVHKDEGDFDLAGDWTATLQGKSLKWTVSGGDGKWKLETADDAVPTLRRIGLREMRFSAVIDGNAIGAEGQVFLSGAMMGPDKIQGTATLPSGQQRPFSAQRHSAKESPEPTPSENPDSDSGDIATATPEQPADVTCHVNFPLGAFGRDQANPTAGRVLFRKGTIWTCGQQGVLKDADVLIDDGTIVAVGAGLSAKGARVVELNGRHVSPGIIDCHSHMATDGGVNEGTQAVTAEVRIGDFIDCDDINIYRQLAGGVTTSNILHGSANPIGGQNQVIKLRWGQLFDAMKFAEAPAGVKFALGENVKRSNFVRPDVPQRYPISRMGVVELIRDSLQAAQQYDARWAAWNTSRNGAPPRRDLELEALAEILRGERWIHCHSYRQDEILALLKLLDEYDVTIGSLQHILEGYKVADAMARHGATGSAFADWWAYKFEVYDAIPYNGALMHRAGVIVSYNSDDRELARHLNHEAAKAVKYGGVSPEQALQFVTLNPAKQLRIDQHVGSLEPGKHADLVVWSGRPLSTLSRCEQTWVDGVLRFDLEEDAAHRVADRKQKAELVEAILRSGDAMRQPGEGRRDESALWPRHDEYCHHGHVHDHE